MWVWRDDRGSTGPLGGSGGRRLEVDGTWVWDEPSPLERAGAGTGALHERSDARRAPSGRYRERPDRASWETGDRAVAALGHGAEPTPIFHELTADRSRRRTERRWRDGTEVHVPEPHPGSGPLPVQDDDRRRPGRLTAGPTPPPPPAPAEPAESPEDELRRRAERRRRPLAGAEEGGRHTWRQEDPLSGRHALRR